MPCMLQILDWLQMHHMKRLYPFKKGWHEGLDNTAYVRRGMGYGCTPEQAWTL